MSLPSAHRSFETQAVPSPRDRTPQIAALGVLVLTAAIALLWSHVKLLSQDEIFVLQTDSVSTVRQLIHIQRTCPISLDPLFYHLLAHAFTKLLGPTALALRLPSILGFLLMQLCVYLATRLIAGRRAAFIALAFPALTATLFYAPEARPYGLLLGLYALTFLAWQTATRRSESSTSRSTPLALLAIAIALTLNTHYFGVLLLVPVCLAELARTLQRRKLDLSVIAAILLGMAGILFTLPFQHAAGEFREHYYNTGAVDLRAITQAYRSLFVSYTDQSLSIQRLEDVLLVLFALALIALCIRRLRRNTVTLPAPELVFLLTLAALPLFGVLLAIFVTHSIEVRYVLSAILAVSIFVSIAIEPPLHRHTSWYAAIAIVFVLLIAANCVRIRGEHRNSQHQLASLILPPPIKAQLLALPDSHLYIQDMGHFELASYYEPDPAVRSRMALLCSRDEELRWDLHDTASLTARHMRGFTGLTIKPYSQLIAEPGDHLLVLYHSGWDWTDQALATEGAHVTPLGPALGGDSVLVRFESK
jgi:hypothetical protein